MRVQVLIHTGASHRSTAVLPITAELAKVRTRTHARGSACFMAWSRAWSMARNAARADRACMHECVHSSAHPSAAWQEHTCIPAACATACMHCMYRTGRSRSSTRSRSHPQRLLAARLRLLRTRSPECIPHGTAMCTRLILAPHVLQATFLTQFTQRGHRGSGAARKPHP